MAGHSQFKNIMHRKNAQDAKRAKLFTRLQHEIAVAAKAGGVDPESNARLRTALINARQANVPKENIDRTLKKISENETMDMLETLRHEGFGPENVSIIVEVLTDNRNRTTPELRTIFGKNNGKMAEKNAASFVFRQLGCVIYEKPQDLHENLMMMALEAGAEDFTQEGDMCTIFCPKDLLYAVQEHLEKDGGTPVFAQIIWKPDTMVRIDSAEKWNNLSKLLQALDDHNDVQAVWHNAENATDDPSHRDDNATL